MGVDAGNISLRVLLVEDDEDDYVLIRELLGEIKGFELRWATGYTEALKELEEGEHDVCLLDYRLGEHSGLELLEEVRSRGYTIPMILLTGQGDREIDLLAMEAGAADYLLKGEIDAPTLERSVRYAFARALRALSESERRLRSLLHNGSDIITVLDVRGVVLYESPSVERVLGWRPEEVVGKDVFDYIPPEDAKEVRDTFERAVSISGITGPVQMRSLPTRTVRGATLRW